jgi:putative ribosome biogenesis GTPase RsgA
MALKVTGPVPHFLLLNKADLAHEWEVTRDDVDGLRDRGIPLLTTSAKTGQNVEEAFAELAGGMR